MNCFTFLYQQKIYVAQCLVHDKTSPNQIEIYNVNPPGLSLTKPFKLLRDPTSGKFTWPTETNDDKQVGPIVAQIIRERKSF
jgi:hypothetical protein